MAPKTENLILAALPKPEKEELLKHAAHLDFRQRYTFYAPGTRLTHLYFLETGMASELVPMSDGRAVDAAPVGREGIVGIPLLLGADGNHHHCLMQIAGSGFRVDEPAACAAFDKFPKFRRFVLRYTHLRFLQATQNAACNLLHTVEQRLGRWLLLARCHAGTDRFAITQEFLAEMLGANRSTITVAIGKLEKAGLVDYRRGEVDIADPGKLSAAACECNSVLASGFRTMYGDKMDCAPDAM